MISKKIIKYVFDKYDEIIDKRYHLQIERQHMININIPCIMV